MLTLGLEPM